MRALGEVVNKAHLTEGAWNVEGRGPVQSTYGGDWTRTVAGNVVDSLQSGRTTDVAGDDTARVAGSLAFEVAGALRSTSTERGETVNGARRVDVSDQSA